MNITVVIYNIFNSYL